MSRLKPERLILAAALMGLLAGCSSRSHSPDSTVVVYTSVDDEFARPIAEQFEKETGIKVKLVPDTEETKSTGLLNRLIAEKARPQADVFWSGDPVRAAVLKAKGVSAPYHSKEAEGLPKLYSDLDGHWTGFSARAKVLIYNKNLVEKGKEPKSVMDLFSPRFKSKACIANPLFGTTSMYAVALFQVLGDDKAKKFFGDFAANDGKVLSSNGEVRRRVADGEYAVGLTDTDDYNEARKDAGKRFIDYLLRPQTEKELAEGDAAQMPVRPGVAVPAHVVPIAKLKPMRVDYAKLGDRLEELSKGFLKDWVDRNSR